jgi:hypothetical protein
VETTAWGGGGCVKVWQGEGKKQATVGHMDKQDIIYFIIIIITFLMKKIVYMLSTYNL